MSGTRARRASLVALALIAGGGAGCASDAERDGLNLTEFSSVERIALLRGSDVPRAPHQIVDRVQGVSCNRSFAPPDDPAYKVVTEYEALFDLRLEAAALGADAVIGVACAPDDDFSGCREALVCDGSAVRLDDGVGLRSMPAAADVEELRTTTALYESLSGFTPDYLTERQRAGLGRLGIGNSTRSPGYRVHEPATGGAAAAQGAGQWFLQCLGQGGSLGLIISPICAAIGAGLGTLSAESEEVVAESSTSIAAVLGEYYVHDSLRERVVRAAAQAGAEPPVVVDAAATDARQIDSIVEVGLEEMLLPTRVRNGFGNQPVPLSLRTRVRIYGDGARDEIYNRSYRFTSDAHLYARWGANDAALLRLTLENGFEDIAVRVVEDLLLVYPLMPVFGASGIEAPYQARRYLITPMHPPAHTYDMHGRPWPARIDSFTPILRWREFPDAHAASADFQGKLAGLSALRYDLRLYRVDDASRRARLVLERNAISTNEYQLEQPLAPDSRYVWSVRARFRIDGGERVTRWSGDWLGRGVKGFYFRTAS